MLNISNGRKLTKIQNVDIHKNFLIVASPLPLNLGRCAVSSQPGPVCRAVMFDPYERSPILFPAKQRNLVPFYTTEKSQTSR